MACLFLSLFTLLHKTLSTLFTCRCRFSSVESNECTKYKEIHIHTFMNILYAYTLFWFNDKFTLKCIHDMAVILNYTDHMNNLDRVQCICLYVRVWERANAQTLLFYGFCLIFRPNDRVHVVCVWLCVVIRSYSSFSNRQLNATMWKRTEKKDRATK